MKASEVVQSVEPLVIVEDNVELVKSRKQVVEAALAGWKDALKEMYGEMSAPELAIPAAYELSVLHMMLGDKLVNSPESVGLRQKDIDSVVGQMSKLDVKEIMSDIDVDECDVFLSDMEELAGAFSSVGDASALSSLERMFNSRITNFQVLEEETDCAWVMLSLAVDTSMASFYSWMVQEDLDSSDDGDEEEDSE